MYGVRDLKHETTFEFHLIKTVGHVGYWYLYLETLSSIFVSRIFCIPVFASFQLQLDRV